MSIKNHEKPEQSGGINSQDRLPDKIADNSTQAGAAQDFKSAIYSA